MSMTRTRRLFAVAATSAALAVGGLAVAPSSPASAATATATATYTCGNPALASIPVLGPLLATGFTVPATFTLDNLPSVLTSNVPIPAGTPISGAFQFPTSGGLAGILTSVGITVDQLLGGTPLSPVSTQFNNGIATISGQLGSFTPTSGSLPIPTSFDASLVTNNPLLGLLGVTCTYNPGSISFPGGGGGGGGGTVGGLPIAKQVAKIKAHQVGHKKMVLVKVKNQTGKATGKVVAKLKGKKVGHGTLKHGAVRMKLKRLKSGVNRIKVFYKGDAITQGANKKVKVKVGSPQAR